ncbi:MAG: glycosyltransferase [Chitinophagales bacterium]
MNNKKKIKVLFLSKWYPNKFDEQLGIFVQKHAEAAALYADIVVLYVVGDPNLATKTPILVKTKNEKFIAYTYYYKQHIAAFSPLQKLININRYWKTSRQALQQIFEEHEKPDLVHTHVLNRPAAVAYYIKKRYNISYCITEHWSGYINGKYAQKNALMKALTRFFVAQSSAFTAVSVALQNAIEKNGLKRPNYLIPNVVEFVEFQEKNDKASSKNATIRFLSIGDLFDKVKNISDIIRVVAKIAVSQRFEPFEYHIIGGGEDEESLKYLAKQLGVLNKSIFFHGRKTNDFVLAFLPTINFLIVNSNYETFSVVTAEALACGKPVIATRCGGPEIFITKENGLLISPKKPQELEDAICYMIENYKKYDAVALAKNIRQTYSKQKIGKDLLEMYESVLKT